MFMYLKNQTTLLSLQPPQTKNSTKQIPRSLNTLHFRTSVVSMMPETHVMVKKNLEVHPRVGHEGAGEKSGIALLLQPQQ
jgi:hypothetical protein